MKFLIDKVQSGRFEQDKKTKKKPSQGLLRPIICICNDPYVPVLRPLRAIAEVYTFKPSSFLELAKRLQNICLWEGVTVDLRATMMLIDLVEGDMRSAIHTLQYLKAKSNIITCELIQATCVGRKDMHKGLFYVYISLFFLFLIPNIYIWNHVFEMPNKKSKDKLVLFHKGIL